MCTSMVNLPPRLRPTIATVHRIGLGLSTVIKCRIICNKQYELHSAVYLYFLCYRAILYVMHGTFAHFEDMPQIIMFYYKIEIYVF